MAPRMNKDDREIWFARMVWSYMPGHWKGWAFLIALVLPAIGAAESCDWLATVTGHSEWSKLDWVVLLVLIVSSWWVAERHSP
jgi:hypothetical protein